MPNSSIFKKKKKDFKTLLLRNIGLSTYQPKFDKNFDELYALSALIRGRIFCESDKISGLHDLLKRTKFTYMTDFWLEVLE